MAWLPVFGIEVTFSDRGADAKCALILDGGTPRLVHWPDIVGPPAALEAGL